MSRRECPVMAKFWAVFKREYLERVRTRWFIIATVLGPLLLGAIMVVPAYHVGEDDEERDPRPHRDPRRDGRRAGTRGAGGSRRATGRQRHRQGRPQHADGPRGRSGGARRGGIDRDEVRDAEATCPDMSCSIRRPSPATRPAMRGAMRRRWAKCRCSRAPFARRSSGPGSSAKDSIPRESPR